MKHETTASAYIAQPEAELLGTLLSTGGFNRVMTFLKPEHFILDIHRIIYDAIQIAFEQYNSTTMPIVARLIDQKHDVGFRERTGKPINAYLAQLASTVVWGQARLEEAAKATVTQWGRLKAGEEAQRFYAATQDPSADTVAIISTLATNLDDIRSEMRTGAKRKTRSTLFEASERALLAAEEAMQRGSGLTGITWGLTDVNRATGGIQRRDLTLIGARPSMGKTSVATSVAIKAAKSGVGVGFFSLEMDADKLGARALSDLAYDWNVKIPYIDLIRGTVQREDMEAIRSATRELDKLPLWIEDQAGLSLLEIRIKLEAMLETAEKAGFPLGVVMMDHLGLIRASSRYSGNRTNEIGELTAGIKALAREYDIAAVLLSQLSRAVESRDDKRPQLADLRDSGAIEQDADTIIFLYREAYYLDREKGQNADAEADRISKLVDVQNKLEMSISKQRNGPVKTVDLFVDIACSAVRNATGRY